VPASEGNQVTRIGCGIWLVLLVALPLGGAITALRRHANPTLGLCCGISAGSRSSSGYMVLLWLVDWHRRRQGELRPENDAPKWLMPVVWVVFLIASVAGVVLFRRF
jgi:hypothetical protein